MAAFAPELQRQLQPALESGGATSDRSEHRPVQGALHIWGAPFTREPTPVPNERNIIVSSTTSAKSSATFPAKVNMTFLLISTTTNAKVIVFTHNVPDGQQTTALNIISSAANGYTVVGFASSDGYLHLDNTMHVTDDDVAQLVAALEDANNPKIMIPPLADGAADSSVMLPSARKN